MRSPSTHPLVLIAGNSNPELWEEISEHLGIPQTNAVVDRFSDGEIRVQVEESVRDAHCFLLQSTCDPVNEHLMELLILIDSLRRASAYGIAVVAPPYMRARTRRSSPASRSRGWSPT
jgi:ribose-phosphate pyrophosphokinase